ncbi:MAG: type II toxin-antitoxin system VapC family toxin [Verrucomicrobia bacterium]|nr:type II toxin-antitoxin system VapC family toxin [Verrucomicrobiota bacterium]
MTYLIDTNIIIFALKDPPRAVARRLAFAAADDIALSSVVEAELYHGAEKYAIPERRREMLTDFLALYHRLPFDSHCVPHYAKIRHHLETLGQIIGGNDLMIAATALAHSLTLITHNGGEFARVPGLL